MVHLLVLVCILIRALWRATLHVPTGWQAGSRRWCRVHAVHSRRCIVQWEVGKYRTTAPRIGRSGRKLIGSFCCHSSGRVHLLASETAARCASEGMPRAKCQCVRVLNVCTVTDLTNRGQPATLANMLTLFQPRSTGRSAQQASAAPLPSCGSRTNSGRRRTAIRCQHCGRFPGNQHLRRQVAS